MMASTSIKDHDAMTLSLNTERIEELARKIAARTGQSPEDAVEQALAEKLSRVEAEPAAPRKKATLEEIMEISKRASARMSPEMRTMDIDDWLYDEHGLPKRSSTRPRLLPS